MVTKPRLATLVAATTALVLATSACGSDSNSGSGVSTNAANSYSLAGQPASGQTCFTQLDDGDRANLAGYAQDPLNASEVSQLTGATDTVCVIDENGNQRYYNRQDQNGFSDYLLYAIMMGRSQSPLVSYGLLTGNLDFGEALMLQYLTGIGSGGSLYHPYRYTDNGWAREQQPISYKVTNVYYGAAATSATRYSDTLKPPQGYRYVPTKKATNDAEYDVSTGTTVKGFTASQIIAKSSAKTPTYSKSGQAVPTVTSVPSTSTSRSGSPSGRPSSGGSTARPSSAAPRTTSAPAPKPKPTSRVTKPRKR